MNKRVCGTRSPASGARWAALFGALLLSTALFASEDRPIVLREGQLPNLVAGKFYDDFEDIYAQVYGSKEEFVRVFCNSAKVHTTCDGRLTERTAFAIPPVPNHLLAQLEESMGNELEARNDAEETQLENTLLSAQLKIVEEEIGRLEAERAQLEEDNAMLSDSLHNTTKERNVLETFATTTQRRLENEQRLRQSVEMESETLALWSKVIGATLLLILLFSLVRSRKVRERVAKLEGEKALAERRNRKWIEVKLPDTVPEAVQRQLGGNAKSLAEVYGTNVLKLPYAGERKGRTGDFVVLNDKILAVGSAGLLKELRKEEVIATLKAA